MIFVKILNYSRMNPFREIFDTQKAYFNSDKTKSYDWRITQLDRMCRMLTDNTNAFYEAISQDFKTATPEFVLEVNAPLNIIEFNKSKLKEWMTPEEAVLPSFLNTSDHKGLIYRDPYGVALIIGPFNAPLLLLLLPAIAALSAGNTVILKSHEASSFTSELLIELIPKYFDPAAVAIVGGEKETVENLLKLPFDFIVFTGSARVGKIVMRAAAEFLTPIILELGGQNPAIVDETASISDAARKLAWGATAWAGQWCTSPGYVYVHESKAEEFVMEAKKALLDLYGPDPKNNPDYSKIISPKEVERLISIVDPTKVVAGGQADPAGRYFSPTLIYLVTWSDKIMEEEIFGPILPIMTYTNIDDVVYNIKKGAKPLAGYIFSSDDQRIAYLLNTLSFGGGAVNQTNIHLFVVTMPFGGIGGSGIGNYYGKHGFDSLTHAKSILFSPANVQIEHLFPPYSMEKVQGLAKWFDYQSGETEEK
jgi:aldehyde dehydrogenase (NAD+)